MKRSVLWPGYVAPLDQFVVRTASLFLVCKQSRPAATDRQNIRWRKARRNLSRTAFEKQQNHRGSLSNDEYRVVSIHRGV